jgi:hypothetical protein
MAILMFPRLPDLVIARSCELDTALSLFSGPSTLMHRSPQTDPQLHNGTLEGDEARHNIMFAGSGVLLITRRFREI